MIVSHKRKFVYIGPPKTASTTLHRWLSQPKLCESAWTPDRQDQHSVSIPPEARGYFVFASWRHELDRTVSLWSHSQSKASIATGTSWPMTFEEFVRDYQPEATWFYRLSQAALLAPVRLDAIVRHDHLARDLARLPPLAGLEGLDPIPRLNRTRHKPWREYYTPELRRIVTYRMDADAVLAPTPPQTC